MFCQVINKYTFGFAVEFQQFMCREMKKDKNLWSGDFPWRLRDAHLCTLAFQPGATRSAPHVTFPVTLLSIRLRQISGIWINDTVIDPVPRTRQMFRQCRPPSRAAPEWNCGFQGVSSYSTFASPSESVGSCYHPPAHRSQVDWQEQDGWVLTPSSTPGLVCTFFPT